MKKIDPSFKVFYHEEGYWPRFNKCIDNFDEIIAQVPEEIKNIVNPKSPEIDIVVEVSDDEEKLELLACDVVPLMFVVCTLSIFI
jgi:hypothetical protein